MKEILSTIGSFTICGLILYIIKKVDEYHYLKKEENYSYKFDKDDE